MNGEAPCAKLPHAETISTRGECRASQHDESSRTSSATHDPRRSEFAGSGRTPIYQTQRPADPIPPLRSRKVSKRESAVKQCPRQRQPREPRRKTKTPLAGRSRLAQLTYQLSLITEPTASGNRPSRNIRSGPFCWQAKSVLKLITTTFAESTKRPARGAFISQ